MADLFKGTLWILCVVGLFSLNANADYYQDDGYDDEYEYVDEYAPQPQPQQPAQGYGYPPQQRAPQGQPGYPPQAQGNAPQYQRGFQGGYQQGPPGQRPPQQQPQQNWQAQDSVGYPPPPSYNQPQSGPQNMNAGNVPQQNRQPASVNEQTGLSEGGVLASKSQIHRIAVIPGITSASGSSDLTVGLEYSRDIKSMKTVRGVVLGEVILADDTQFLGVAGLNCNFWREARALVAVGGKFQTGSSKLIARAGLSYEFRYDKYSISPRVDLDVPTSGDTAIFYGVALGTTF